MTKRFAGWDSRVRFVGACVFSHSDSRRDSRIRLALRRVLLAAAVILVCGVGAFAQAPTLQPSWNQLLPTANASSRSTQALAYDAAHGQVVMFGGFYGGYLNDTWLWNGTTWTQVNPTHSPSPRSNAQMVYDAATGNVVLFGGLTSVSTRAADTWTWNGTDWTQLTTAHSPTNGRASASMVYDAATHNVVLFGGLDTTGTSQNDTWIWDGNDWTQANPANSPSARNSYAMAYDAAHSQVVLFGGSDVSLSDLNDTWTWDGTNWTAQNPTTPPLVRDGAGMDYDPALGGVVMFGGEQNPLHPSMLNDTWVWNGTSWTQQVFSFNPQARFAENALVYDAAQAQLILFGGENFSTFATYADTWALGPLQDAGMINVCPVGSSTPTPCGNTISLEYNIANLPSATVLGAPKVVTQGASALDFIAAGGGTCEGETHAAGTCTVLVTFAPLAPGVRTGAVNLVDNSGNVLVSTPIYGTGEGAFGAFTPLAYEAQQSLLGILTHPKGVLVDAAGDLFVSDYEGHQVVEVGPSTSNTPVIVAKSSQIVDPQGLAMDGAGNLYVADTGTPGVFEIPWGCIVTGTSSCQHLVPNPMNLTGQFGVSVDRQGDLFVSAYGQHVVVEVPVNGGAQTVVYNGTAPIGTAVDAAGDLFVADANGAAVVEVPAGCPSTSCYVQINSGNWSSPESVSLDAAGDLYVTDGNLNQDVVELPVGCSSNTCAITIASRSVLSLGNKFAPYDAVTDAQGNVYIADWGNQQVDVSYQGFGAFNFEATTVNNVSADSPQSVIFQNTGNETLTAAGQGLVFTDPSFSQAHLSGTPADCVTSFSLAPGAPCTLGVRFDPLSNGGVSGLAKFNDNALNNPAGVQGISFTGTGVAGGTEYPLTLTETGSGTGQVVDNFTSINCNESNGVIGGSCSGTYVSGTTVTLTASMPPGSAFIGWGGACASSGTNPQCNVTMNQAQNVSAGFLPAGSANVCVSGAVQTPPCSTQIPVTFNFTGSVTVNSSQVVTEGYNFLDFQPNGDGCSGNSYGPGNSCIVNVTFTPQAVGVRMGAVVLQTSNGPMTQLIHGMGLGPVAAFSPLQSFGRYLGGPSGTAQPSVPLNSPQGVLVDANGNIFISDTGNNQVLELQGNSTNAVYSGGPTSAPQGLAVDGAGNLYVADTGLREVMEVPAGGGAPVLVYAAPSGGIVSGVAVDATGDLFIAVPDYDGEGDGKVLEFPANGGASNVLYSPGSAAPKGMAVDAAGDLFVADPGLSAVVEIPVGCDANNVNNCQVQILGGLDAWFQPAAVAVDAAGDVYVADPGQSAVKEVPAGCASTTCELSIANNTQAYSLTVDPLGVVSYVDLGSSDNGALYQVLQQFYGLNFGYQVQGFAGTSSTVTLQNVGNQALNAISPGFALTDPTDFNQTNPGAAGTCTTTFSLAAAQTCHVSIDFAPGSTGPLSGNANFTDNALNNSASEQTFALSGTGINGAAGGNLLIVGDTGSGTGTVTSNDLFINCVSGNSASPCAASYTPGSQVMLTAAPSGTSIFLGWGGACVSAGTSNQCTVTMSSAMNVSAIFQQQSFGGVSVCAGGLATGCTGTNLAVTFNFTASTTFTSIQVLTQGATGLDFQQVAGGNCTPNTYGANSSCTMNVAFTPLAPGVRQGAVQLLNGSTVVASQFIYGIGQGAEVAFGPTVTYLGQSNIPTSSQVTAVPNLTAGSGMTTDAAGNLYQVTGTTVVKVVPGGNPSTVATGFTTPQSVAIDGAGNLYVADSGLNSGNGEVLELAKGCASASCGTVVYTPQGGHPSAYGIAVDGLGNLFVAVDENGNTSGVYEVPAGCTSNSCAVSLGNLWVDPRGVALDATGDLFVADSGRGQVMELPAGCQVFNCEVTVGTGWNNPNSVTVDAAGDVIVADPTLTINGQIDAGGVVEVPTGCTNSGCQILLWSGGAPDPFFVTSNGTGQIFIGTDGTPVVEINQSQPPSLNLGNAAVGTPVGPDPLTIQNIGNQNLTGSVALTSQNFSIDSSSNCGGIELLPGKSCTEGFDFDPVSVGALSDQATVSDNSLNGAPATQIVALSGTGTSSGPVNYTLTVTGLGTGNGTVTSNSSASPAINCSISSGSGTGTCSESDPSGTQVILTAAPSQGSVFGGWGGACASSGTNEQCTVTVASVTSVTANFAPGYQLSVTLDGSSGTVTSNVGGISCNVTNGTDSGTCLANESTGASVTLTAAPGGNSIFAGWGGACASSASSATCMVTMNSAVSATAAFVAPGPATAGTLMPITAGVVYGQGGSLTSNTDSNGGISANSLSDPAGGVLDSNGNLYVGDTGTNRVLFYPHGSTTATRVYGQGGSFTTAVNNQGGISKNSLNNPYAVAVDSSDNLYVADQVNNRVLFYPAGSTTATRVYGQGGSFTTAGNNQGGISANSLSAPYGVAVDSSGNLYVGDSGNNRVLFYQAGNTTATRVYGQGGSFTTNSASASANGLNGPLGLTLDSSGDLYVADELNNRVLFFPSGSTTATRVYGQNGNFTSSLANLGGNPSANSLNQPFTVALDSTGNLYVGDTFNHRVLFYLFGSTTATRVYGQLGSFTSNSPNPGGVSADTLVYPEAVVLNNDGSLYVADYGNNRVVEYGPFGNFNVCSGGTTPAPCNGTFTLSYYAASSTTFATPPTVVTQGAPSLDFTPASGTTCSGTVNAGNTCTVNVKFAPLAPGSRMGAVQLLDDGFVVATQLVYGVGNAPAIAFGPGAQTTVPTSGIGLTSGVAVDASGNVYISTQDNQVVEVSPGGVQTTVPTAGLNYPYDIAVDGAGNVFLVDTGNNRVVKVSPAGFQTTVPATGLSGPTGVAVDAAGDVFITDNGNNRVVKVTATGVQTTVPTTGISGAYWPAVDAAGDVFFSDNGNHRVVKVSAGGVQSTVPATGLIAINGVAVDAAGDVFISDQLFNEVVEVTPSGVQSTLPFTGLNVAAGVAVDWSGDVFVADHQNNRVEELVRSQAPAFTFPNTNVGTSSSPASVTLQNVGNQNLTGTASLTSTQNFSFDPTSDCGGIELIPGASCTEAFDFAPTTGGSLSTTAQISDNSLNGNPATQVINLSGTGVGSSGGSNPLTVSLAGSGSGTVTDNNSLINCVETNGASSGTCIGNIPGTDTEILTAAATTGSTFLGWGGACASSGTNLMCTVPISSATSVTATFTQGNFGGVSVCAGGIPLQCTPTSLSVTFNVPPGAIIGAVQVVTQGATGLDFNLGSGSTCAPGFVAPGVCTVNVNFTPLAPGLRTGAAELYDNAGNVIASTPVYGTGQGPVSAFNPAAQAQVNTGGFTFSHPNGVMLDAAGDLFIGDTGNQRVVKLAANGTLSTVGFGLQYPQGMAMDGAGDLFIADNNLNQVVEIPAGCTTAICQKTVGTGYQSQLEVAVDAIGDVFFSDYNDQVVVEVAPNGTQTVVYSAGAGSEPVGVAVDAAGDVFVGDLGLRKVVEIPVGCTNSGCQISLGGGWSQPQTVAVDAAGDVFVADNGFGTGGSVLEVPPNCIQSNCVIPVATGAESLSATVDAMGNIFYSNNPTGQIFEVTRSLPTSVSFPLTNVGSTSNPQAISLQNVGTQPLTGTVALSLGQNFIESAGSTCTTNPAGFSLPVGGFCSENISFTPQNTDAFTGTVVFSDNTFNLSPLVVSQSVGLSGTGGLNGQAVSMVVPNVLGMTQASATTVLTSSGLTLGAVSTGYSSSEPAGTVMGESPAAGTQVTPGAAVAVRLSIGQAPTPSPNPLSFENNYFVTGDYATGAVTLRAKGVGGMATGTISISNSPGAQGIPDGADIVDGFLYWEALENTASPSANNGTFNGYSITGQQVGSDIPYTDGAFSGTLRVYRADVNEFFPAGTSGTQLGVRFGSGSFTVSLPDSGGSGLPLTEGVSLVEIYRVLSPNFPLKSIVIYDGAANLTGPTTQNIQGFYDAVGGANGHGEFTALYYAGGTWNGTPGSVTLGQSNQYVAPINASNAYAAIILSTPVNNSDNDGILDAWKTGPPSGDFFFGQPGYYDVKTSSWVALPGAQHGHKDLFVQFDYMCGAVLASGVCDPTQENLYPSPDPDGKDPLVMVQNAFTQAGISLHLQVGNAVAEDSCSDNLGTTPPQLCQFPGEPGVIGWKNSLEFSKLWPRNFASCAGGGDCTARFPYGQKDSYHYVLFGHSLAIPAWNSRYGSLASISVASGVTTISTSDRGTGINACPARITIAGVLSNPTLNGVYNTASCPDTKTIVVSTPGVPNWTYNFSTNTPHEPAIGITSGTVTSISGYSDLGGADSAVTLALWETYPGQNMSKRANVVAGTMFHEIGHTLGLSHGGLYYDGGTGNYVPTFEVNCKPNYQSIMNYLFQLDGVGVNGAVAFSNQTLAPVTYPGLGVSTLLDINSQPATFSTSAWYVPYTSGTTTASQATIHCDGTPIGSDAAYYRVNGSIAPITPAWQAGQNITYDGVAYTTLRGYNDVANVDLRQVGATGGEFASLASVLSFGYTATPVSVQPGGNVTLGSGGTVTLGSGGNVTLGSGGNVTLGSGGTVLPGTSGSVTLNNGGTAKMSTGGTITLGSGGNVTLGDTPTTYGTVNVTVGSNGTITLGSGGNVILGSGGNITLGSGGTIALGSGGNITIPSAGGTYSLPPGGGTVTLGSGGNITLGSGGTVTLGSGGAAFGNVVLGSGGNVVLGSGGNITLGSGGNITLGSGGNITLGSGGNVTLGSGGTVTLGSGGNVTLGSGGNVTLGSGGNVTLGSGGNVTLGSGGNVTLGSGGTVTLGSGGNITLGSGGNVTLGSGGNVILGSGGTIALGSGGTVAMGSGGSVTFGAGGGTIGGTQDGAGTFPVSSGQNVTFGSSGGNVTLGSGGNVTLGSGGTVTLGSGGNITLGSGGTMTLVSGGNVTLGSGGNVTLGSGGNVTLGSGGNIALGSGGNVTLGSGGVTTNELDYGTANSWVRPPPSATYTPEPAGGTTVNWTAPDFGVVQSYSVYLSINGGTPALIATVAGSNGNPPATTYTDTTQHGAGTLTYTIVTNLVPDQGSSSRQSVQSPPAVRTVNQTIVLGTLPSSVTLSTGSVSVTATTTSSGPNLPLEVSFAATGACSIGSQSFDSIHNISSAMLNLSSTGSCNITASQAGEITTDPSGTSYNAAQPVSASFAVVPENSGTTPQIINFPRLPNVPYGSTFPLNATSNSGITITYMASGPCTTSGTTTGIGPCTITASAPSGPGPNNSTYPAASVSQTFTIIRAVLTVTGSSLTTPFGQIPSLTSPSDYTITGFVNGESASVLGNTAPALSTTATTTSDPAIYPITVAKGTLSAANYSFFFVPGTLTVQSGTATISISNIPGNAMYGGSFAPTYLYSGNGSPSEKVVSTTTPVCTVSGNLVSFVGLGTCTLTASATATTDYSQVTGTPQSFNVGQASQTISFTQPASPVTYGVGSITLMATGGASGNAVTFSIDGASTGTGTISGNMLTVTAAGTLVIDANQAGNTNYTAAVQVQRSIVVNKAMASISVNNLPGNAVYGGSFTPTYLYSGNGSPSESVTSSTTLVCTVSGTVVNFVGVGSCTLTASATTTTDYSQATGSPQSFNVGKATPTISINNLPGNALYGGTFTPTYLYSGNGSPSESVTSSTTPVCTVSGAVVNFVGVGTCTLTASATTTTDYTQVTGSPQSFGVGQASQTINFTQPTSPVIYGVGQITLVATGGGSGNPVIFSIDASSTGTGTISGTTLTITSAGTLVIDANQAGNSNYKSAAQVQRTIVVNKATASISINNIPGNAVFGGSFVPTYTYTGVGTPSESTTSNTPSICSVSGNTVSFIAAGSCSLTANATATTDNSAATGSAQSFNIAKASQTITFAPPTPVTYGVGQITLTATGGGSGNAVTFTIDASSTAGAATLSGTMLKITGAGTVVIDANQAGNANYNAASQVKGTIAINQAPLTVTANPQSRVYGAANPTLTVSYGVFVNGDTPSSALSGSPSVTTTATTTSLPGQYPITVTAGTLTAKNYSFKFVNGILTVTATASVPPSGTACNGAYTGTFSGNITVSKGQTCIFVGGGTTGSITETGGNLVLDGSTIGSGVTINGGGTFNIGPSSTTATTIKGNLTIQSLPKSTTADQVCGTTVTGSLVVQSDGTPILIGNSGSPSCAGNTIKGSLQVASNSASITMDGNSVTGSIQVQSNSGATIIDANKVGVSLQDESNTGATQIFNNIITNALQCQSNSSITGGGNTAASKSGQCSKF